MADITMCDNKICKDRFKCHRFTAKPDEYHQSYFLFFDKQIPKSNLECNQFWNNKYFAKERKLYDNNKKYE